MDTAKTENPTDASRELTPPAEGIPLGKIPAEPVPESADGIRFDSFSSPGSNSVGTYSISHSRWRKTIK